MAWVQVTTQIILTLISTPWKSSQSLPWSKSLDLTHPLDNLVPLWYTSPTPFFHAQVKR
jgi:hypothetical protein